MTTIREPEVANLLRNNFIPENDKFPGILNRAIHSSTGGG